MQKKDIYCYDLNKFFLEKRSKHTKNSIHANNIYKPTKKVLLDKSHKIKIKIHPELQGIYYCFEELFKSCYQDLSFFFINRLN